MYKITSINNIKVATFSNPQVRSVSLGVWIDTGSRYEAKHENGISHFLEHMVFKGTTHRNYLQIKEAIEGHGGLLNGFTTEEFTCFLAKIRHTHLGLALEILLDLVCNPVLKNVDIEKERAVIFEELRMYFDLPQYNAYEHVMGLLWPNQPLGRNIAGSFATLKQITRRKLINYKQQCYTAKNIAVVACGNLCHSSVLAAIKNFTKKNKQFIFDYKTRSYNPAPLKESNKQTFFMKKKIEQTHLCFGMRALQRDHPQRHALSLLHIILGANMSSRLFNEVREKKGLAYEIGTSIKRFADCGAFIIHAGIVTKKVEQAVLLILKEIKKIKKNLVRQDEFRRAKDYYIGQLLLGLEDTAEHMLWMGDQIMTKGVIKTVDQTVQEIQKVKIDDIMDVGKKIFQRHNLYLSAIGSLLDSQIKELCETLNEF